MDQSFEAEILSPKDPETATKVWVAPTMTVAKLTEITEAGFGGTYTDGSSIYARS